MILKEIYLYPEVLDFGEDFTYPFKAQTRCLCNYVGRRIKEINYQTPDFGRVCFVGRKDSLEESYINSCKILGVDIFLKPEEYLEAKKDKTLINEYFISLLFSGFEMYNKTHTLPNNKLEEIINDFRKGDYNNEWIFKKKRIIGTKFNCVLKCSLTSYEFSLDLQIINKDTVIFEDNVVKEIPDDFVFHYYMKDFLIDGGGNIEVFNKSNEVIYSKNIREILKL